MKFIKFSDFIIAASRISSLRMSYHAPWLDKETGKTFGGADVHVEVNDGGIGYVEEFCETEYESRSKCSKAILARWNELFEMLNK
jgi:hypothetical protein